MSWVDDDANNRVDEFTIQGQQPVMSPSPILSYPALGGRAGRHSIGWIGFKPGSTGIEENHLYINTADGGFPEGSADYQNVSQDLGSTYGKVLRVEVATGADVYPSDFNRNFGIPLDNPYVGVLDARDEVFHSGLRNPWRASFDRDTGDMYLGDVGWLTLEEIDFAKAGQSGLDFGWSNREGTSQPTGSNSPEVGGPKGSSIDPIFEYGRSEGASTVGGYVYRGPVESIQGDYFFADTVSGNIWQSQFDRNLPNTEFDGNSFTAVNEISSQLQGLLPVGVLSNIVSFGEDNSGNLYLVKLGAGSGGSASSGTGEIYRLTALPDVVDRNDIFLLVDPVTGQTELRNQSGTDIAFDAYALSSLSGSLSPDSWTSLQDMAMDSWRESNPSTSQLAELLQAGSFVFGNDQILSFGSAFDAANGVTDLVMEYLPPSSAVPVDVPVVYGAISVDGDFNGNGSIEGSDFLAWQRGESPDPFSLSDLTEWSTNYNSEAAKRQHCTFCSRTSDHAIPSCRVIGILLGTNT